MGIFDEQRRRAKVYVARRYLARLIDGLALGFIMTPIWVIFCANLERRTVIHGVAITIEIVRRLVTDGWNGARNAAIDGAHAYWVGLVQVIAVALALVVAVMTLYEWLTHAWFGRSLGKALVGIKVISLSSHSEMAIMQRASAWQSALRAGVTTLLPGSGWVLLAVALSSLDPIIALVGVALVLSYWIDIAGLLFLYNGRRACFHDLVSGTIVVSANYESHIRGAAARIWKAA